MDNTPYTGAAKERIDLVMETLERRKQMTENNQVIGSKFHLGEKEFTNIIWTMIRAYRFRNSNENPEAIVLPDVKEVNGVKIEYPEVEAEPKTGKAGS